MQINRDEILNVSSAVCISQLYKNWYAAECIVNRGGRFLRLRYPYRTPSGAMQMISYLQGKRVDFPRPDYQIQVHVMNMGR
jgi:hypothetical protein